MSEIKSRYFLASSITSLHSSRPHLPSDAGGHTLLVFHLENLGSIEPPGLGHEGGVLLSNRHGVLLVRLRGREGHYKQSGLELCEILTAPELL